jgi:hypothetical protein
MRFEPSGVGESVREARREARPEWQFEPSGVGESVREARREARPEWIEASRRIRDCATRTLRARREARPE